MSSGKNILLVVLLLAVISLAGSKQQNDPQELVESQPVSMIQLLATPEKYYGKVVSVLGCLEIEAEASTLHFHCEDYERVLPSNGIWIELNEQLWSEREALNGRYIRISGVFSPGGRIPNPSGVGGLDKVRHYQVWPDIREELEPKPHRKQRK